MMQLTISIIIVTRYAALESPPRMSSIQHPTNHKLTSWCFYKSLSKIQGRIRFLQTLAV